MNKEIRQILESLKNGSITVDEAALKLKTAPFEDLGFAKVDHHRSLRQGVAEVIYGAGKTERQIIEIAKSLLENGQKTILITRLEESVADAISKELALDYNKEAKLGIIGSFAKPYGMGKVIVATGGTSDIPVAEEAAVTAEFLGNEVIRLYDVGVAGLYRLLDNLDDLMSAS
ncbi:MAG TPA: 1-(5-phosphoribosyl)-5-amino-4-imidazole-carboxylate carboxylase, partial [Oscillospiraceae bacterium]|nr:1-(5-phosphoribosyl)-5-amino-4-imidazole-carboxylate carboxylase [Oscillospiraceae bacterium]